MSDAARPRRSSVTWSGCARASVDHALPFEAAGVDDAARRARVADQAARRLHHAPTRPDRGAAAVRRRRLDRRRQVDAGQHPGRQQGQRARRAATHHPVAGARAQSRRRALVRRRPAAARARAHRPHYPRPGHPPARREHDQLASGLAILDAPDVDSVEERNRGSAAQLLSAADLWLFVTSAARYADQVPWEFLKAAAERSTAVAVVLDRTTPQGRPRGEQPPRPDDDRPRSRRLAAVHGARSRRSTTTGCCRPMRSRRSAAGSTALAADAAARDAVVRKTLDGAVASLGHRTRVVVDGDGDPGAGPGQLRADAVKAYADASPGVDEATPGRHHAARRGAGALAGVRRHGRADEEPRGQASGASETGCSTLPRGRPQPAQQAHGRRRVRPRRR